MVIALAASLVTVVGGDYRRPLLASSACTTLSLACLAVPFARGPTAWRVLALLLASPALFILLDLLRRAPHAFGGG